MLPIKLIITSKKNLQSKYGNRFVTIEEKLDAMVKADNKRMLDTRVVYIDDAVSAKRAGIKTVKTVSPKECKQAVDDLFKKHIPAYITILGAQDIFPFQDINNPAEDDDAVVPTDLPYACDAPFSKDISAFTGPTRVVGRLPDIPGVDDSRYLVKLLQNSIRHKPKKQETYANYFSVSANVWKRSTELSLSSIFGHNNQLLLSPPQPAKYTKAQLKPLVHFYNCHGAPNEYRYFGQKGNNYPDALRSFNLKKNVAPGTVVAAECCYGAELVDPSFLDTSANGQDNILSIANTYLQNNALAFLGSSTIAYGPADSQGLADLITQYFIKSILKGASTGRALLEARQKFLSVSAPHLDPYELKTLAQFYLLGDPSVQPAICADSETVGILSSSSIENNRIKLFSTGKELKNMVVPSTRKTTAVQPANKEELKKIIKKANFTGKEKEVVYEIKPNTKGMVGIEKKLVGEKARFRTFIKTDKKDRIPTYRVLVVKENEEQLLGWKVYVSR